jgi:hypothetical protein
VANKPWRVAFQSTGRNNEDVVTVFHVKDSTPLSADLRSASDLADVVNGWLTTLYRGLADSQLTVHDLKVTEVVDYWNGTIADQHVKSIELAGTLTGLDHEASEGICVWSKAQVSEVFKGNHGGWHTPPQLHSTWLTSSGVWATSSTAWTATKSVNDALLAGVDYDAGLGHVSYILYSQTRHRRGDANYYFDVTNLVRDVQPHFLRSRLTTP